MLPPLSHHTMSTTFSATNFLSDLLHHNPWTMNFLEMEQKNSPEPTAVDIAETLLQMSQEVEMQSFFNLPVPETSQPLNFEHSHPDQEASWGLSQGGNECTCTIEPAQLVSTNDMQLAPRSHSESCQFHSSISQLAHGNHTLSTTEAEGEATTIKSGTPAPQPADIVESTVKPFAWDQILNLGESSSVELKLPRIEVEAVEEPTELSQKVNETVNRPVDSEFASEPEEVEADKGKGTAADVEHHGDATITNNNASLTESHEQMSADESEKQEAEVVEGEPKDTQSESIEHEEIALTQAGNGVTEDNAPRILCRGDSPQTAIVIDDDDSGLSSRSHSKDVELANPHSEPYTKINDLDKPSHSGVSLTYSQKPANNNTPTARRRLSFSLLESSEPSSESSDCSSEDSLVPRYSKSKQQTDSKPTATEKNINATYPSSNPSMNADDTANQSLPKTRRNTTKPMILPLSSIPPVNPSNNARSPRLRRSPAKKRKRTALDGELWGDAQYMEKNREALTPIWEDVQIRWVPVKSVLAKYIAPDYDMLYLEASCVKDALAELLRQEEENSGALTAKAVLELVATWRILVKGLEEKLQLDKESNKKVKKFDDKVSELEAQMHFVTCIEDIPRSHHDEEKGDKDYKGEKSKKKRKQKP